MKPLIYMVAFGNPLYARMAEVCIESLRAKGRYQGDIVVVTEGSFAQPADPRIHIIHAETPKGRVGLLSAKSTFAPLIDASAYDRIMVMDTDIAAISDISPLFDTPDGQVCAASESPFHTMAAASAGAALTSDELAIHKDAPAINVGVLVFDARTFHSTMKQWAKAVDDFQERGGNRYIDQPPFNAMIVRGEVPFHAWPVGWIEFPPLYPPFGLETQISPEAKLLHFCASDKQEVLHDMLHTDELLASIARGEKDAQRYAKRDLFFLHEQIKNWKEEAALQARVASERQVWIDQLEEAKAFLAEQNQQWKTEAAFQTEQVTNLKLEIENLQLELQQLRRERIDQSLLQARLDAERRQWVAQLEEAKAYLAAQQQRWETEAAYQKQQALNWKNEVEQLRPQLEELRLRIADGARAQEESQAWMRKLEEAKVHLTTQAAQWETEAAYQTQQALNWKNEVEPLRLQLEGLRVQASDGARAQEESQAWMRKLEEAKAHLSKQAEQWETEAAYQKQQALNWKHEAEQLRLILDQREAQQAAEALALARAAEAREGATRVGDAPPAASGAGAGRGGRA